MVSYNLFRGFLSGPTKLVGVSGLQMLQRPKYDQVLVICLLFANVAKIEMVTVM
jgi:hypothetical protein